MKIDALKKIISEVVKTAVREEFRDIIIEAIKKPAGTPVVPLAEVAYQAPQTLAAVTQAAPEGAPYASMEEKRAMYANLLTETHVGMQPQPAGAPGYTPNTTDPLTGDLGSGEVSMEQIMGLTGK